MYISDQTHWNRTRMRVIFGWSALNGSLWERLMKWISSKKPDFVYKEGIWIFICLCQWEDMRNKSCSIVILFLACKTFAKSLTIWYNTKYWSTLLQYSVLFTTNYKVNSYMYFKTIANSILKKCKRTGFFCADNVNSFYFWGEMNFQLESSAPTSWKFHPHTFTWPQRSELIKSVLIIFEVEKHFYII